MKILVVRFRQMGDSVVATSLLNTLRYNSLEYQMHFVLNGKIAPLFHRHPRNFAGLAEMFNNIKKAF